MVVVVVNIVVVQHLLLLLVFLSNVSTINAGKFDWTLSHRRSSEMESTRRKCLKNPRVSSYPMRGKEKVVVVVVVEVVVVGRREEEERREKE